MSSNKLNKFKNIAIIVLAVGLFFSVNKMNQNKDEYERQYKTFINHFYFSIKDSQTTLNRIIELHHLPSVQDNLEEELHRFNEQMLKTNYILQYGNLFVDRDIYYFRYFQNMNFLIHGLHSTTNNRDPIIVPPFAEDGVIDEAELAVLKWIKDDLDTIQQGLYSEETRQENPNITVEQFNEIVRPIVSKSFYEIANKYNYEQKKIMSD